MARCREHYDVLFVYNKCNLIGVLGLRSITNHHRTPCRYKGLMPISFVDFLPIVGNFPNPCL